MVMFNFLYPQFLWLLTLIPIFVLIYFVSLTSNKKKGITFGNFKALERFYGVELFSRNFFYMFLNIIILTVLILGLAGLGVKYNAYTSDFSFVIAVDTSSSMLTSDIFPTRFEAATVAAKKLVSSLPPGTTVGVVGFSGASTIYQDMTNNKMHIFMGIDNLQIGNVEGTNIYDALITADNMFDTLSDGKQRAVILISDGQINIGDTPLLIDLSKKNDLIVYTIGVGDDEDDDKIFNMISKADVDFLKSLSFNTGGKFFRVKDGDFSEFLSSFDSKGIYNITIDLSSYLIIIALFLFFIDWILYNFRFRIYP